LDINGHHFFVVVNEHGGCEFTNVRPVDSEEPGKIQVVAKPL